MFKSKKSKRVRRTSGAELLLTKGDSFGKQEAYKALRTNTIFSLPGKQAKCIGVTSATMGDGKSITAANLAISFAQMGERVVLIDCDMRLPTIASKMNIKGQPGLSDFLVGNAKLEEVLQKEHSSGVDVIPSGTIPPDPTRLLESKQINALLNGLKSFYSYIIIDLPPVTTVTDATILSKYIDGFLLVVRHKKSEFRAVKEMLRQLQFVKANIIGFVYTGAPENGKKYYRNYYYEYGNTKEAN